MLHTDMPYSVLIRVLVQLLFTASIAIHYQNHHFLNINAIRSVEGHFPCVCNGSLHCTVHRSIHTLAMRAHACDRSFQMFFGTKGTTVSTARIGTKLMRTATRTTPIDSGASCKHSQFLLTYNINACVCVCDSDCDVCQMTVAPRGAVAVAHKMRISEPEK